MAFLVIAGITGDGEFNDLEETNEARQQATHNYYDVSIGMRLIDEQSLMDCMISKIHNW